ncbi:MAG: HesA/MoeB/ThiF family protein [Anaerovoracaceae bacterium]
MNLERRYERNRIFSRAQQEELSEKRAAVIGCGGLGGYAIEMLARVGVGHIKVCDGDVFDETNLNRQLLCTENILGKSKAEAAVQRVRAINSEIEAEAFSCNLTEENASDILDGCDVVIDALDSVGCKMMLQKVCRIFDIPMVHGAIGGWFGQVTTIFPGNDTLSLVYGEGAEVSQELGNPSFTPAIVASIQVSEAVKVMLGIENVLMRKLLFVDLMTDDFQIVEV